MHTSASQVRKAFIDPLADYGEVEADLGTIEAWGRANGVAAVDGRIRVADVAVARSRVGLPKYKVVPRALNGAASEREPLSQEVTVQPPIKNKEIDQQVSEQVASARPSRTPDQPIATNETELLNLVTGHNGTITGLVTPEIASYLLILNTNNRPMSDRGIDRFIKILQRGAWQNTGEAIIVADTGELSDGQHRLTAIKRSGIAALCDVRFGIPRAAFAATGTGARRTTGNAMAIAGKPHATMQAAIGRLLVQYDAGYIHRANIQVESDLVIAICDAEPAIGVVAATLKKMKFSPARVSPFGLVLVLASRATTIDRALAFARLVDEGRAEEDDPTRRLHIRLRDAAMAKERITQLDVAILTVRAWNAWIEGRAVQSLRVSDADRTDDGFPKVKGPSRSTPEQASQELPL